MNQEPEYFENNEDVIENFDILNDKFRNSTNWIGIKEDETEIVKEELNPLNAFKNFFYPLNDNDEEFSYDTDYKEKVTDPFQRIQNLKHELIMCKTKIDDYAEKFNNNEFLKQNHNINKVLEELEIYKSKIDAFVDYNLFNNPFMSDDNSEDNSNNGSMVRKSEFTSIFEKYNRITDNLISIIKQYENDVINNNVANVDIKYEICSNPQIQMESLIERVGELEDKLSALEKNVGNWDIYTQNENIGVTLAKLLNFLSSKMNERYEKKHQAFKECGNLIGTFLEKKKELLESGSYFIKIKELYAVLELFEHFDHVFDYIKKRLKAIKEICDNSDQFSNLMNTLSEKILKNEQRFKDLLSSYEQVLNEFADFENILGEISEVDNLIKSKNIII